MVLMENMGHTEGAFGRSEAGIAGVLYVLYIVFRPHRSRALMIYYIPFVLPTVHRALVMLLSPS